MTTSLPRRTLGSAAATLTALALLAPAAQAATTGPSSFAAESRASGLRLSLNGPAELLEPLGQEGGLVLDAGLARAVLDSTGTVLAETLVFTGGESHSTTEDGSYDESVVEQTFGLLTIEGGSMTTDVDEALGRVLASSQLLGLTIDLQGILDELPEEASGQLEGALEQAEEAVGTIVGNLNGALGQVEDAVNEATGQAPVDLPEITLDDVPVLDLTEVPLLQVGLTDSRTLVETVGDTITSTSTATIEGISLLGGAIEVPRIEFVSTAVTDGTPGGATSSFEAPAIEVSIAGQDIVIEGTSITVAGVTLDLTEGLAIEEIDEVLAPVFEAIQMLLDAGGLSVLQGDGTATTADDGSEAAASTSALAVRLRPLQAIASDLLDLNLELAATGVSVAGAPAPVEPPTPAAPDPDPDLPRTGGGTAAVLGGSALLAAAALRRRRED